MVKLTAKSCQGKEAYLNEIKLIFFKPDYRSDSLAHMYDLFFINKQIVKLKKTVFSSECFQNFES